MQREAALSFVGAAAGALLLCGCPRVPASRPAPPLTAPGARPLPSAKEPPPIEKIAVLWAPAGPEGLLETAEFLEAHPAFRTTAVLPERLFSDEENSRRAGQVLAKLVARRQIEPLLTLPGDPPLTLILDTDLARSAGGSALALPPRFAWPEDVTGHVAQAQNLFRKRWRREPRGLVLPGGVLVGPELVSIERLKILWIALLEREGPAGIFGGLPVGVVRPAVFPDKPALRDVWHASWRAQRWPVDEASGLEGDEGPRFLPPVRLGNAAEISALAELLGVTLSTSGESEASWVLISEAVAPPTTWPLWSDDDSSDFSLWIGEPEENLAWRLLGMTRQAVEDYQNSGRADVRVLDLALREIYAAESGRYFRHFGGDVETADDPDLEREFLAGLAQVYRLMSQPVPQALFQSLASTPWQARSEDTGGSSFFRTQNVMRWTDAAKDDRGPGDFFYPSAPDIAPGSWDVVAFEVRIYEKTVVFQFEMTALSNPWKSSAGFSGPLADVYIDINRIPGAGSETLLPGRPGIVEKQNAWEYALTADGSGARLFQYSPGSAPRLLARLAVKLIGPATFRIEVPRHHLRGDPVQWGYGVVVMGDDGADASSLAGLPMRVLPEPGPRQFGGAWHETPHAVSAREAPPFIDLVLPPGVLQSQVLGVYKSGRDVVIPFVRAE